MRGAAGASRIATPSPSQKRKRSPRLEVLAIRCAAQPALPGLLCPPTYQSTGVGRLTNPVRGTAGATRIVMSSTPSGTSG